MGRYERYIGLGTLNIGELELQVKPITGDVARFAKIAKLAEKDENLEQVVTQFTNFVVELVDRAEPLTEEDKKELKLYIELHLNEAVQKVGELLGLKQQDSSFRA